MQFLAPNLLYAEVGNILWKKVLLKELEQEAASCILNDFQKLPFEIQEESSLNDP